MEAFEAGGVPTFVAGQKVVRKTCNFVAVDRDPFEVVVSAFVLPPSPGGGPLFFPIVESSNEGDTHLLECGVCVGARRFHPLCGETDHQGKGGGWEFAEDDVLDISNRCNVFHRGVGVLGHAVVEVQFQEINLKSVFCVRRSAT